MICPECHSPLTLNDLGETVCTNCGLVVNDFVIEKIKFSQKRVLPYRLPVDTRSKGSLMALSLVPKSEVEPGKFSLYKRLNRVQQLSPLFRDRSTLYRAIRSLERVSVELNVPENVRERAIQIYFKLIKLIPENIERPNHYRLIAASLIFACKEAGLSLPIKEVISCFKKLGHKVNCSNVLKVIFYIKRHMSYNPHVNLRSYVYSVLESAFSKDSRLAMDELKMKIYKEAIALLSEIDKKLLLGRNPYIIALAAIYAATVLVSGKRRPRILTQRKLSSLSGFSISAIRSCYKSLFKELVE